MLAVSFAVLKSLFENLDQAHRDPAVKAIVVIGSNNNFSPGFDIQQFRNQAGGGGIDNQVG
jgi:enoyl-CoA hydratase/carnithine racemase